MIILVSDVNHQINKHESHVHLKHELHIRQIHGNDIVNQTKLLHPVFWLFHLSQQLIELRLK